MSHISSTSKAIRKRKPLDVVSSNYFRRLIRKNIAELRSSKKNISHALGNDTMTKCSLKNQVNLVESNLEVIFTANESYVSNKDSNKEEELSQNLEDEPGVTISHAVELRTEIIQKDERNLENDLARWVVDFNIQHRAVNSLLLLLKSHLDVKLPNDCRTLLKTRTFRNSSIVSIPPGKYWHYGIAKAIKETIVKHKVAMSDTIKLNINIDGLPLAKSSNSQMWPILGTLTIIRENPTPAFAIGIYHGVKKPESVADFMQTFITEFNSIKANLDVNGRPAPIILNNVICDAPAKAFLLGIKSHNAYFGCTKCIQEGKYINGKVTYPETNSPLRTDAGFRARHQEEYHKTSSPLEQIPEFGLVSQVPLDYMHLVCLGVMKKLILFWVRGRKNTRMLDASIDKCNITINEMKNQIPKEFSRKPRSLLEVEHWKATEFRLFLLYTGPIILKDTLLHYKQYIHFLSLHVAIRILTAKDLCIKYNGYAKELLIYFVKKYSIVYGAEHLTHNVHNLIHLCDDVLNNGEPLDNFSAFPYENYLQSIKKKIKCSKNPLQQIMNRLQEDAVFLKPDSDICFPLLKGNNSNFKTSLKFDILDSYTILQTENFVISVKDGNNCVMLKSGSIVIVKCIFKLENALVTLIGNEFRNIKPYFASPCSSTTTLSYIVKDLCNTDINFTYSDIKFKCLKVNQEANECVIMCLLHKVT